jgi:hypothetical protein
MADQLSEIRRKVATLAAGMKPPLWSPGAEYARDVPYLLAQLDAWRALVGDLAHWPAALHPDSSTVTAMSGLTGKSLRHRIGWSCEEQEAWVASLADEDDDA